ncbi:Gfo/Idh/MocA family protein [Streptomyces sp. VRA16 Mangrove soil]|uniref:Gfo/Idh/MocA family protein n=1 Tax=Streptomyces sp. VRA16 Mangrove soil TaxID=2817434 RepID=UPI001A9E419A|nr:Gfo/Idh/MocA family oxidoreductase [Streptomyces sp. VRA16 Mangrove soil]MBO1330559.1 Gfo/Idh/MocA family oxidoreductase [Streptomyces sp. VRA16 Mangrove soil]
MTSTDALRLGLVGTGSWARRTHAPTLADHKHTELVGVWGRRPQAAAELAAAHATTAYDDADALFAACDAVAFAVPPDVQAPLAARAAAAGCHLLLDKPLATEPVAARAVVDAVEAARVASVVFCTMRYSPASAAWIAEQASVEGWFTGRADWYGALYTPGDDAEVRATTPWRAERGALWDVGPHALSVLLPLLGDVTSVTAGRGPGDTVHLLLRHASGASSTAALSLTTPPAAAGVTVELRGTAGVSTLPAGRGSAQESLAIAVDVLLESVRTGVPAPCDARFGLRLTEILTEAERSLG